MWWLTEDVVANWIYGGLLEMLWLTGDMVAPGYTVW